jgi:antitoxin MazE
MCTMKVKVAKWGNSLAVRLPKVVAEDLGLVPGREVDIEKDGTRLTMETARKPRIPHYRLQDLLAQIKPGQKPAPFEDWSAVEPPWPDDDWSDIAPSDEEWEAMKRASRKTRKAGPTSAKKTRRA